MRGSARKRATLWTMHYAGHRPLRRVALFPLWLFKVSVTPNNLLYSKGVRMWPSRTSFEHYASGDPAHVVSAVLPQQRCIVVRLHRRSSPRWWLRRATGYAFSRFAFRGEVLAGRADAGRRRCSRW